jgi:hypothetical protein
MNNTFLIECNNLASQKTQLYEKNNFIEGDTFKEKIFNHRWKTKLPTQINLQVGDRISIEKAMINSKGQSDETIELTGQAFNQDFKDNEVEMEFGYYLNNNFDFNLNLPKVNIGNKINKSLLQVVDNERQNVNLSENRNPILNGNWTLNKSINVQPEKTHGTRLLQGRIDEQFYSWETPIDGLFYSATEASVHPFLRKYGSPRFNDRAVDYFKIDGSNIVVDTSSSMYSLTQHTPINNLGYNKTECSTGHILLNKPDAQTRFYIGKRKFEGFYDDNTFDIKKSRTKIKLQEGFNNPVVISQQMTSQMHEQVSNDFSEPFEKYNYAEKHKLENVSDKSMKVQTTFAGNIMNGQLENDSDYYFKLPNQNQINSVVDIPDTFRYANRADCEKVFWNQLLVGDINRAKGMSAFYGGITSINANELQTSTTYLEDNINVFSGSQTLSSSITSQPEYDHNETPLDLGIQPVIFDDLTSFSTNITEEERTNPKNAYWNTMGSQEVILDKGDLHYLADTSFLKLNLQDGDVIPTNMFACEDNFNRIEQLLRNMEKPSDNDIEVNFNNQQFKDSLDFYLEYNRLDDKLCRFKHQAIFYEAGGRTTQTDKNTAFKILEPETTTLQKNAFPWLYNMPSPKASISTHSLANTLDIESKFRMPVFMGQYIDIDDNYNLNNLRADIASDNFKVSKIDPVSINTYSRYNPNRTPKSNNLRLPSSNVFNFQNSNGEYFDDTLIKNKDLGVVVAYTDIKTVTNVEVIKVGAESTDRNVSSILASSTLPFSGEEQDLIGADAFNPYGSRQVIYGLNNSTPATTKSVFRVREIDQSSFNLDNQYTITNGSLSQSTLFNNMKSTNTTSFVSIDTTNNNALSATNSIQLEFTIPSSSYLEPNGTSLTKIRIYFAYDTNNDIAMTDYGLATTNLLSMPTKIKVEGAKVASPTIFNLLMAETDYKDRFFTRANHINYIQGARSGGKFNPHNIDLLNTNLSQEIDDLKPYIELNVDSDDNYNELLSKVRFTFTENAISKIQGRICIKDIKYYGYSSVAESISIGEQLFVNKDDYTNLNLINTPITKLNDNSITTSNEVKINYIGDKTRKSMALGVDAMREVLPSNNNLRPLPIDINDVSVSLNNPYEVGDVVDYVIAGMGQFLSKQTLNYTELYGFSPNSYPTNLQTLPHTLGSPLDNSRNLFSDNVCKQTSNDTLIETYSSSGTDTFPHYINFDNRHLLNEKVKITKLRIIQPADKLTNGNPNTFTDYSSYSPSCFAIFGSNIEPDSNERCVFGMNLLYCTATDYNQFLSSLVLQAGTSTTISNLSGFTNSNPSYGLWTDTNTIYSRHSAYLENARSLIHDVGLIVDIPISRQKEYKYYRILIFDNFNNFAYNKDVRIGTLQVWGDAYTDRCLRPTFPTAPNTYLPSNNTKSILDLNPLVFINGHNRYMNREQSIHGWTIKRYPIGEAPVRQGSGWNLSISSVGPGIESAPVLDTASGHHYVNAGGTYGIIGSWLEQGSNYAYQENQFQGEIRLNDKAIEGFSISAYVELPLTISTDTLLFGHTIDYARRFQLYITTSGRVSFTCFDGGFTLQSTTNNEFNGYKGIITFTRNTVTGVNKIFKGTNLLVSNTNNNKWTPVGNRCEGGFCIGGKNDDYGLNTFNPGYDGDFKLFGVVCFNYCLTDLQALSITTDMLNEPIVGSYKPIRPYNINTIKEPDHLRLQHTHLLTNHLQQSAAFDLSNFTSLNLDFDLIGSYPLKYIDIFPAENQSDFFPESVVIQATNTNWSNAVQIGSATKSHTAPTQQSTLISDTTNLTFFRINISDTTTAYRYIRVQLSNITGLSGITNSYDKRIELAGLRIIGDKTLTSSDMPVYNKFYGLNYFSDNHSGGTFDKMFNGKLNFPSNAVSLKYQHSNSTDEDAHQELYDNGYKFFDYDIYNRANSINLDIDLGRDFHPAGQSLFFQKEDNTYKYTETQIYFSKDGNTWTSKSANTGLTSTVGTSDFSFNNTNCKLFENNYNHYDDLINKYRYIRFNLKTLTTSATLTQQQKMLYFGDYRIGDIEIYEWRGKQFQTMNDTNNYLELIYTNHIPLTLSQYKFFPNDLNCTIQSNQDNFNFIKNWKLYGSNDRESIQRDRNWVEIDSRELTNSILDYVGGYTPETISPDLLAKSPNDLSLMSVNYTYYKWRFTNKYATTNSTQEPYINLGELQITELTQLLQPSDYTDYERQIVNANLIYNSTALIGNVRDLVDNVGSRFRPATSDLNIYVTFEEEIILTKMRIWGSFYPDNADAPSTIAVYRINDGTETLIESINFTNNFPNSAGHFQEDDIPSNFEQYSSLYTLINATTPAREYKLVFNGILTEIKFTGRKQEYNILGSLYKNLIGSTITATSGTNINALTNNSADTLNNSFKFNNTDTHRTIKIDFHKQIRLTRYGLFFADTSANYLKRWKVYGSNTADTSSEVPDDATLLDDKSNQDYNPTSHGNFTGVLSENISAIDDYDVNNSQYYQYYYLECLSFENDTTNHISELIFYGNENYDVSNVIDNKLGEVDAGPLTDAYIYKKSGTSDYIQITLKKAIELNKLKIWKPMNGASQTDMDGPTEIRIYGLQADQLPFDTERLLIYDEILSTTSATYQNYTGTDLLDASENTNYATTFTFNYPLKSYKAYVLYFVNDLMPLSQKYVGIAEIALYKAVVADKKDVPMICFVAKQKQDHNGGLQLMPSLGEMIGPSRSFQNNKWSHIFTTKPNDLPQLAIGIDGISYNKDITSSIVNPFGDRTIKNWNNNWSEADAMHYSPYILVGAENVNFKFDTDLARVSLTEMNTAMQQGQNLSTLLRYEDYRSNLSSQPKDNEANTQVVKFNIRKYSVNSSKYGSSYSRTDNGKISYRYPYNLVKFDVNDNDIPSKTLLYVSNNQGDGIFSSQTGIGLLDIYVNKTDGSAHKLTTENTYEYKNTLFDKLGFTIDQLISPFGNQNKYYNRHTQDIYVNDPKNSLDKSNNLVKPLTTNAYINATINTTLDASPLINYPMGKLGSVGIQTVNSSYQPDELIGKNKPSKFDYSHLLLYSNIVPKYNYVGTNLSLNIPCIGNLDRTYSSGDFVYAQSSNFDYTVDLPYTLSEIDVDLRLADGRNAPIDENSTIIFRIDKRKPVPLEPNQKKQ